MASTYSTNLAIELIGTGDQAGTWGTTTNSNLGTLIEQSISGYVTQAVSTGTDTTITIPNGSTGVARNMYIELTGTGGSNTNLVVPANKKLYFIFNNSTGAVTVKVSAQTGVSVPTGKKMVLVSNGTDIVNGLNYIADFATNSFTVTNLTASSGTITNLLATSGSITNLVSSDASATVLRAGSATLTHLSATSATITNLTLTSLVISNLSIASANITTLTGSTQTLSGNLTLSGGTANGVLYLNGSKVATSGSALTFDGTTLNAPQFYQKQTLAAAYTTQVLENSSATGYAQFQFNIGAIGANGQAAISYAPGLFFSLGPTANDTTTPIVFRANNSTEYMRLDSSGNLGIGTSSPASKLEVTGDITQTWAASMDRFVGSKFSTTYELGLHFIEATRETRIVSKAADGTGLISFYTGVTPTVRAVIDASGNLGLGVTPSAWGGGFAVAQYKGGFIGSQSNAYLYTGQNAFFNGTDYKYIATAAATLYEQTVGKHVWYNAASGTAGNTISFTQAMTLDASNNLGIGTTTIGSRVTIGDPGTGLSFTNATTTSGFNIGLLAGTGSANAYVFSRDNADLLFGTNNTERARISAAGEFIVGYTSAYATAKILGYSTAASTSVYNSWNAATSGTRYHFEFRDDTGATSRGSITTNGTATAYNTSSDRRLKDNIAPADNAGSVIDAIEVVKHDWKVGGHTRYGMIAQDLHMVAPEAVSVGDDGEELKTPWGVDYSKLVPMMMKELQSLRKRVAELETK